MKKFLLPVLLFTTGHINAQSVLAGYQYPNYTDINPDTLLNYTITPYTHEVYGINMFGDAANDVEFVAQGSISSGGSSAYISVTSLNPNVSIAFGRIDSVYAPGSLSWDVTNVAKFFATGEQIDATNTVWNNTTLYLTDHSAHQGASKNVNDWVGGDKHVGLKYQNGGNISYGWIKVRCVAQDSCYIKEFSAAPAVVGIKERSMEHVFVYPNPVSDMFFLKDIDAPSFNIMNLKLKDVCGKEIEFSAETFNNDVRIDLDSDTAPGCYFLEYVSADRIFSQKIVRVKK
ncbi:MAG: Secretion system C-terminal sorting domain [Bacteroidota bacterium]|jgi:hypothetical protein|nr:Secretion system C-terminal sorting domain [Bacteroidota bacterium]